jgi:integrase
MAKAKAKVKRGNNEGTIYQLKDGSWMAALTIDRDPSTGRLKRKYLKASTRREAHQCLAEAQGQYITRGMAEPSTITLNVWAGTWWHGYVVGHTAPRTVEEYERQIRRHIVPALGHLHLQALRVEHVQRS